jgi:hypothetical protein
MREDDKGILKSWIWADRSSERVFFSRPLRVLVSGKSKEVREEIPR